MSKHNGKAKFATSISVLCLDRVIDYYVMSLAFGDHPSNHNCMYMREFDVSNKYLQQRILQYHIIYFYRLSIKMRKGNVLVMTVCQSVNYSVHEEGVLVQGPHPLYTGPWSQPLSVESPVPYLPPLPLALPWPQTCSNLSTWTSLYRALSPPQHVQTSSRTGGKRVVGIRLKCLRLYLYDYSVKYSPLIEDKLRNYVI